MRISSVGKRDMKSIYCSKYGGVVPGLEEDEFEEYSKAYMACVEAVKSYRAKHGTPLPETPTSELFRPAKEKYRELTGFEASGDSLHLYSKHRVESFPLYCSKCDLMYRAPRTGTCPECGDLGNEVQ